MWTTRNFSLRNGKSLILLLVFLCIAIGCSEEEPASSEEAQVQESSQLGKERLSKATEIKNYGFDEKALQFYEEIASTDYPPEIRQDAYWKWIETLEERESNDIVGVGKQFSRDFPQHSSAIDHRLLQFYLKTWNWPHAYETMVELDQKGSLKPDFVQKRAWVEELYKRSPQWQEPFNGLQSGWSLTNPYGTTSFFHLEEGKLAALLNTPSWYHAGYRFQWNGGNTVFSFDIVVQEIEIGAQVNFGFFRAPTKLEGDYLKASFTCHGEKGERQYELRLIGQSVGVKSKSIRYRGEEYRLGAWYRVEIDYVRLVEGQNAAEARMTVKERDSGKVVVEEAIRFNVPLSDGAGYFGYASNLTGQFGSLRFKGKSKADNLSIETLPDYINTVKPGHRFDYFYKANLAMAEGERQRERRIYMREMKKDKCPWLFWEMRALGYLEDDDAKASLKDLKELVRRCPNHPTKPYLDSQISMLEKKLGKPQ